MDRFHFARVCVEVSKKAPLPSKIKIKSDENESATAVKIVVDYQGKPKQHGNGHPANQKSTSNPFSLDGLQAGDNSQSLTLNHAVTTVEQKAFPISPKAKIEVLVNFVPGSQMSGGLEDHSLVLDMKLLPLKGACAASGEYSTCGPGPVSLSPLAEADVPFALGTVCLAAGSIGTLRPNVAIISSLFDVSGRELNADGASHEEVVEAQLGSLPFAKLDGKCYEAPVTKEHDVSRFFLGSGLQPLELLPADGVPTGDVVVGHSPAGFWRFGDEGIDVSLSNWPPPSVPAGPTILENSTCEQLQLVVPESDSKLNNLSPLARRVAARINSLREMLIYLRTRMRLSLAAHPFRLPTFVHVHWTHP
ncbi:hypothetical protein Nepgr_013467 [Nepenthes gracilis]|uniref:Uncharacterized protein n=1 Tax=Nepenthes gracilis TaxID=150966 RepID=A0AAD3XPD6_NEPGR|nr:hypothetical protein Nepgr_013467 [Nepenthes gracilis]